MLIIKKFFKNISIIDRWNAAAHFLVILFILVGFLIYKDFGIFADDPSMRDIGLINLKSVYQYLELEKFLSFFMENPPLPPENIRTLKDNLPDNTTKFYGVIFDFPVGFFEYIFFGINGDTQKVYQFRTLIRFLVFVFFLYSFYYQSKKLFSSSLAGFVTLILIILSPKIVSSSFFNHKDILFMIFVSLGMSTVTKLILFQGVQTVFTHSLVTSLAIATRPMGIFFLPLTICALFFSLYLKKNSFLKIFVTYLIYFFLVIIFIIIFSPYLWDSPIKNFYQILNYMLQFPHTPNSTLLYMGDIIHISKLPWHYIPVSIFISTPPLILLLFIIGLLFFFINLIKKKNKNINIKEFIISTHILIILIPVVAVIIKKSSLHNDWRQMYFIYPSFILTATYGFIFINENIKILYFKNILLPVIFLSFVLNQLNWLFKAHPLQNIYFNFMAGSNWKERFDLDYGGVGNYHMIKNILLNDKSNNISICPISFTPITYTLRIINQNDRERIKIQCSERPKYLIQNYITSRNDDYAKTRNADLYKHENYIVYYQKKIFFEIIITVYKRLD